jgi:methyl-accepting chemotaxis protein
MHFGTRKRYFIRRDFQSRFILRFVTAATVWGVTTVLLFVYLAGKKLDDLRYSSHIDIQTTSELLLPITVGVHAVSLLLFAGILAYTVHSLWQRLLKPLSALKGSIATIADGDLTGKVILRKEDEFQYVAEDLDEMRRGLQEKFARLKERQQELSAKAREFSTSTLEREQSPAHAASLQSAVERMREDLRAFHWEADASSLAECRLPPHENRS